MNKIIEVFKGAVMGIANVIPGLSGGTIAVAMGIYEKLINALSDILKHPLKVIKDVWLIVLGILIGIVFSVVGISYLLEHHEVPSTMLFVGFILGSLPIIIKEVENKKVTRSNIIAFLIMIFIVVSLPMLSLFGINMGSGVMNPGLLFVVGMVAAATMIVPGVSGSMVLMTIGYYDEVMQTIKDFIVSLKDMNTDSLFQDLLLLVPFGIGVLVGIFIMAKVMKWLLSKFKLTVNWAILGLIVASPFAIITKINLAQVGIIEIIVSIITFAIGYFLAYYICKLDEKLKKKEGKVNGK
ncbi:MAG: DUF368 domain-containing protein [Clostridia bacterium]|nr:DUF368 domain-containing protein [Clostridia bacterium]